MKGAARLKALTTVVKRKIYSERGEPYRFKGHTLRFLVETAPVKLRYINSASHVLRYDALQLEMLGELLREGDRAIDVGARSGSHTLIMAALCGPTGDVTAFEPNPEARAIMVRNVNLNKTIKPPTIEAAAVSNRTGTATLYCQPGSDDTASLVSMAGALPVSVPTVSLDDYLSIHYGKTPRVVKIDTEGAEIQVLQGAKKLLASDSIIFCEIHPYAWPHFGNSFDELRDLVRSYGRRLRYIHEPNDMSEGQVLYGILRLDR